MIAGLFHLALATAPTAPTVGPGASRIEHLYLFGGIAIGFMLGLLVSVAVWSALRRKRRDADLDERQRRRLGRRVVGQDAWAEAADRLDTPTADDLNQQHGGDATNPSGGER